MRCIICCEDKPPSEMSVEHVFPESIGGRYTSKEFAGSAIVIWVVRLTRASLIIGLCRP